METQTQCWGEVTKAVFKVRRSVSTSWLLKVLTNFTDLSKILNFSELYSEMYSVLHLSYHYSSEYWPGRRILGIPSWATASTGEHENWNWWQPV